MWTDSSITIPWELFMEDLANSVCKCTNTTSRYNMSTSFATNHIMLRKNSDVWIHYLWKWRSTYRKIITKASTYIIVSSLRGVYLNTFSLTLCRDKVPINWTWTNGFKWTIQAFHVYYFQLTNADCQASKRHCKIVYVQPENTLPTLEKGLVSIYVCVLIVVHIPTLETKGQPSKSNSDSISTIVHC